MPLSELVKRTEGYAGREIEQIGQIAINQMIRRTNPDLLKVVDQGLEQLSKYQLKVEPLNHKDLELAFDQVKPLADEEVLHKYTEWQADVMERPVGKQAN